PARWVIERLDDPRLGKNLFILVEQDVDHEPNYFTRSVVFSGGFVRRFRETSDQLLEDVPHVSIGDRIWMQVDLGEPGNDKVQEVRLVEASNLLFEPEVIHDLLGTWRKALYVTHKVEGDVIWSGQKGLEVELADVVEAVSRNPCEDRLYILDASALQVFIFTKNLVLGPFQDAIEPSQHRKRKDDATVLRLLVITT